MDEELRQSLAASRSQLKAAIRTMRTALQFLTDLDEKLTDAQPEEGTANGNHPAETIRA